MVIWFTTSSEGASNGNRPQTLSLKRKWTKHTGDRKWHPNSTYPLVWSILLAWAPRELYNGPTRQKTYQYSMLYHIEGKFVLSEESFYWSQSRQSIGSERNTIVYFYIPNVFTAKHIIRLVAFLFRGETIYLDITMYNTHTVEIGNTSDKGSKHAIDLQIEMKQFENTSISVRTGRPWILSNSSPPVISSITK